MEPAAQARAKQGRVPTIARSPQRRVDRLELHRIRSNRRPARDHTRPKLCQRTILMTSNNPQELDR